MDNIQELLKKYTQGKITPKEMIKLSELINDGQSDVAEKILSRDWNTLLETDGKSAAHLKPLLHKIHYRIRLKEKKPLGYFGSLWRNFKQIAAIIIIHLIGALMFFSNRQVHHFFQPASYSEIICSPGARAKYVWPDGSTVILNRGSGMELPVALLCLSSVKPTGEAYFNVLASRYSFQIITMNLKLEVSGKILNVIAHENENADELLYKPGLSVFTQKKRVAVIFSIIA